MNCAVHPQMEAAGYCRNCGRALCAQCVHNVHGMLYCEDCLARTVAQPPAPVAAGTGSPVLAALLGFIPGLGAVYNGEYTKAIVHVAVFAGFATALNASSSDTYQMLFGLPFACFYLYMPIDAYRVAKARRVPSYPVSVAAPVQGAAAFAGPVAPQPPTQAGAPMPAPVPVQVQPSKSNWWVGPIILVALGVLFLLGNFGLLEGDWPRVAGPVILILIGGCLLLRRLGRSRSTP